MRVRPLLLGLLLVSPACAVGTDDGGDGNGTGGGKADSGWLSDSTYEVGVVLRGSVTHAPDADWEDLATNRATQLRLVDTQVKFAKNEMAAHGYHVNQLTDEVRVLTAEEASGSVRLAYEVTLDMVAPLPSAGVPTLAALPRKAYDVTLPVDPIGVRERAGTACASDDSVREDNYYYYFAPDKAGCELVTYEASLEILEVFPRRTAYPEYDLLAGQREDGSIGFAAAILPTTGDDVDLSIFDDHKEMLEELGLTGVPSADGAYVRYAWTRGDVRIDIDLFDPTKNWHSEAFTSALAAYQLVVYDGHSSYGTLDLLTSPAAYSNRYQIVLMDSCRSYEYYSRQVFRSKATGADPRGWALADVVVTAESPTFGYSGKAPREVLSGLMDGLTAVAEGRASEAPTWIDIIREVNEHTGRFALFGAAGVRTNAWQPAPAAE